MTEQHETFPGKFQALLLIGLLIVIEVLVFVIVLETDMFADIDLDDVGGFITVVGNGILFIGLMAYKRIGYAELFHPAKHSVAATMALLSAPILLVVPGLALFTGWMDSFVQALFPMSAEDEELLDSLLAPAVLSVLFTCVAAPVLEEMLFRGVILRAFLRQNSRRFSILWSATLFGIAHFNVYQLVTAFVAGLLTGWLYERSRSLWPGILLHAAYNGFVTYDYYVANARPEAETTVLSSIPVGVAIAAAVVGGATLLRILSKRAAPYRRA
jgi:membrane protease YdiL (CAAX protease family)